MSIITGAIGHEGDSQSGVDEGTNPAYSDSEDRLCSDASAINGDVGAVNDDDVPLLDDCQLVKKADRAGNLVTAITLTGIVFLATSVFSDAFNQWVYARMQEQVLGANFTKLNISVTKDPCLEGNGSSSPYAKQLDEAQSLASSFNSKTTMLAYIPAIFVNFLFGAYSDHIGRKLFFIIPISSFLINYTIAWVVCNWNLGLEWMYIGFAINGLSGSKSALNMAVYTYTADNTDETKTRSLAMVVVSGISQSLGALSHLATGYALTELGYMWPLAFSALLVFIGLVGIVFFLKETLPRQRNAPCLSLVKGVQGIFGFYLKKPENPAYKQKDFLILDLIFVLYVISTGPSIQTLFLEDHPFCWNSKKIGIMEAIVGFLQSLCPILVLKQLQKYTSDETVCVISLMSAAAIKFSFSVAQADWMIYMGLALSLMQSSVLAFVRAILSKMVPGNKRGSLMASLAVIEVTTTAAAGAGLNQVYSATVAFWRGLTYFIVGCCMAVAVAVLIGFIIMKKRRQANSR